MISIKNVSKSYGTKLVLITLVFILKKGRFTALLVKMVLGKQHYSNVLFKKHDGDIICSYGKPKNFWVIFKPSLIFSKITGNEYLRLLCNARNIEQQDLTEKNIF
jgi:ABC-2 type transport system ATP-binding protein